MRGRFRAVQKTEIGGGFPMCVDTVAADQGLLIGGVNTLDLRWGQNRMEDILLVVELRLFPAESCLHRVVLSPPL